MAIHNVKFYWEEEKNGSEYLDPFFFSSSVFRWACLFLLFLLVLGEDHTTCFAHIHPTLSRSVSPSLVTKHCVLLYPPIKTNLCCPNILGYVIFQWNTVNLPKTTPTEKCLSLSQSCYCQYLHCLGWECVPTSPPRMDFVYTVATTVSSVQKTVCPCSYPPPNNLLQSSCTLFCNDP